MERIKGTVVKFIFLLFITLFSAGLVGSSSLYYKDSGVPHLDLELAIAYLLLLVLLNTGYYLLRKFVYKDEDQTPFRKFLNISFTIQLIWGIIGLVTIRNSSHTLEIAASVILVCPFIVKAIFFRAKPAVNNSN